MISPRFERSPTELISSGVSIETVRRRLGHASTDTTQLYALLDDKVPTTRSAPPVDAGTARADHTQIARRSEPRRAHEYRTKLPVVHMSAGRLAVRSRVHPPPKPQVARAQDFGL
jgi:hypothetical protein